MIFLLIFSNAENYFKTAQEALLEMIKITGKPKLSSDGILKKGVIVRHLVLPGTKDDSLRVLEGLIPFKNDILLSLMCQYTPREGLPSPLHRTVTRDEYRELLDYAATLGITKAFTQDLSSASDSFIPDFSLQEIITQ